jgi:hypothetical protein
VGMNSGMAMAKQLQVVTKLGPLSTKLHKNQGLINCKLKNVRSNNFCVIL